MHHNTENVSEFPHLQLPRWEWCHQFSLKLCRLFEKMVAGNQRSRFVQPKAGTPHMLPTLSTHSLYQLL